MKVHSRVGLVTNSSSETYVWPKSDWEAQIMAIGDEILRLSGSDAKASEVFDIVKELDSDQLYRITDNPTKFGIEDEAGFTADVKVLNETYGKAYYWSIPTNGTSVDYLAEFLELITKFGGEVPMFYDDGDYNTRTFYSIALRNKATGHVLSIESMFNQLYNCDTIYNG